MMENVVMSETNTVAAPTVKDKKGTKKPTIKQLTMPITEIDVRLEMNRARFLPGEKIEGNEVTDTYDLPAMAASIIVGGGINDPVCVYRWKTPEGEPKIIVFRGHRRVRAGHEILEGKYDAGQDAKVMAAVKQSLMAVAVHDYGELSDDEVIDLMDDRGGKPPEMSALVRLIWEAQKAGATTQEIYRKFAEQYAGYTQLGRKKYAEVMAISDAKERMSALETWLTGGLYQTIMVANLCGTKVRQIFMQGLLFADGVKGIEKPTMKLGRTELKKLYAAVKVDQREVDGNGDCNWNSKTGTGPTFDVVWNEIYNTQNPVSSGEPVERIEKLKTKEIEETIEKLSTKYVKMGLRAALNKDLVTTLMKVDKELSEILEKHGLPL
jgi:hypothetical protein